MLAAQLVAPGRIEAAEVPVPRPGEGQALLRARRASICGSDIHIVYDGFYQGDFPAPPGFPGHEGVGQVEESRTPDLSPGDWVVAVPPPAVARCFAEYHVVDGASLVPLPDGGDPDRLLLAQQLGTVVFAFRRHWPPDLPTEGRTAAILGAGSAGLFFAQLARLAGFAKVIVADRSPLRVQLAKDLGADVVVEVPGQRFVDVVLEETGGLGADYVVEAVGYDATRLECLDAVRPNGRLGYFGFPERPDGPTAWSYNEAWRKSVSIEVVHGAQHEPGLRSFREAVELIDAGKVDVGPFVSPVYPLGDIQAAFEAARAQQGGKIAVALHA